MAVLTDLASAEVKRKATRLYGTTLTLPTLMISDGVVAGYACDVNISSVDATGMINQYMDLKKKTNKDGSPKPNKDGTFDSMYLTGLPGQPPQDWQLDDSLPGHVDTTLHNVPLARNNAELRYADRGAPVILERTEMGTWLITGFSIQQPGSHTVYPVDLGDMTLGTMLNLTIVTRVLTLSQLGEMQPFGALPFGAAGMYRGEQLVRFV